MGVVLLFLFFFPSALIYFFSVDVEIVFALLASLEISEWDCVWAKCEWANGRARWRAWGGLSVRIVFKETNACTSRGACGLVRVWDSPPPWSLLSLIFQLQLFRKQWNVKCSEYLYSSVPFSWCLTRCECCACLNALLSPCYRPFCVKLWCSVAVCMGWGTLKVSWSLQVSSEADVMNVWQVPIERLCLKCWRMHFSMFCDSKGSLK